MNSSRAWWAVVSVGAAVAGFASGGNGRRDSVESSAGLEGAPFCAAPLPAAQVWGPLVERLELAIDDGETAAGVRANVTADECTNLGCTLFFTVDSLGAAEPGAGRERREQAIKSHFASLASRVAAPLTDDAVFVHTKTLARGRAPAAVSFLPPDVPDGAQDALREWLDSRFETWTPISGEEVDRLQPDALCVEMCRKIDGCGIQRAPVNCPGMCSADLLTNRIRVEALATCVSSSCSKVASCLDEALN